MPLIPPPIDQRSYQNLLDEALARIPSHTPEWTNVGAAADPGLTLIEVFAFLTESLLYRANQIPERNRLKFLQLLGMPLAPATSARGLVTIAADALASQTTTLNAGQELRAGDTPFRTQRGLDVLPVDGRVFYKRKVPDADGSLRQHYNLLYASLKREAADEQTELLLYETVVFDGDGTSPGLSLGDDTVDGCLWLALLARPGEAAPTPDALRQAMAGKTLSVGMVPVLTEAQARLAPDGHTAPASEPQWRFAVPKKPVDALATVAPSQAAYRRLDARARRDVLLEPGVVEVQLPSAQEMQPWTDLDPLEAGADLFPPALDDTRLDARLVTWIRISCDALLQPRLLWLGANAVEVEQRDRISGEVLEDGNGEPDQVRRLAQPPLIPGSLKLLVEGADGSWDDGWAPVDDLLAAGAEVRVLDPRLAPGSPLPPARADKVFLLDAESGEIRFGDGLRGRRPRAGARLRASYDHSRGAAGNVGRGTINVGPSLPPGFKVSNPIRTWGGCAAESAADGEKQIARHLQHRDRLVAAADFEALALRTPGVELARVEVLPAFNPELSPDAPGNAPGAVTLLLVPRRDPAHPDTPEPDRLFLNAVCRHLDPRRLVTTELILRGPSYRGLWLTVGIDVLALGRSAPEVREDVKRRLQDFLAPLRDMGLPDLDAARFDADYADMRRGWPLRKAVSALELMAVASRVSGVRAVHGVRLADLDGLEAPQINMVGLQLPRVMGIAVQLGDAPDPRDLMGGVPGDGRSDAGSASGTGGTSPARRIVPVPVIPENC
jgi:hypothetical protein